MPKSPKNKVAKKTSPKQFPFDKAKLQQIVDDILLKAKKAGASSAESSITINQGFAVQVRMQELENIEHHCDNNLSINVYFGHHIGSATTSDLNPETIKLTLEKACHIAQYTQEDPCIGLADKELMAYQYPELDLYHPWNIDLEQAVALTKECEAAGLQHDKRIVNSEGAAFSTSESFGVHANTHGFSGNYPSSLHSLHCILIAKQQEEMQRDFEYTIARDSKDLKAAKQIGVMAAERTLKRLQARNLPTQDCPIIFTAEMAKSLLGNFVSAISGGNLYHKTTFLLDKLGKQVLNKHITINEEPHLPNGMGSAPFDNEGVLTKPRALVENGVLQGYVLNSYTARKLKMQTTGNAGGIHNLFINSTTSKPDLDLNGLIKQMGKGFLVTELLGQGVNITTGDYSRGAFGFWVENGVIQYPVTGVTIAGNLKDLLLNIVAIGNDIDKRDNIFTGSILLDKMKVAGSER
jgi:PmbA protein